MAEFGYVIYKDYIIIFGGTEHKARSRKYFDNIYVLDISDRENEWKEINIKCPQKSTYLAVLADTKYDNIGIWLYSRVFY